jgi:hypothetical protein
VANQRRTQRLQADKRQGIEATFEAFLARLVNKRRHCAIGAHHKYGVAGRFGHQRLDIATHVGRVAHHGRGRHDRYTDALAGFFHGIEPGATEGIKLEQHIQRFDPGSFHCRGQLHRLFAVARAHIEHIGITRLAQNISTAKGADESNLFAPHVGQRDIARWGTDVAKQGHNAAVIK